MPAVNANLGLPMPVKMLNPNGLDWRTGAFQRDFQYWDSVSDAVTTIGPLAYENLTVNIKIGPDIIEHWYKGGTALENLVPKTTGASNFETITAGEALVVGDLVYLSPSGSYFKVDYKDYTKCSSTLRIVKSATIASGADGEAYSEGKVPGYSGLDVGFPYFVGVGAVQTQVEINTDAQATFYKRSVGTAISATEFWFQPDNDVYAISTTPAVSNNQVITVDSTTVLNDEVSTKNITETRTYSYIGGASTLTLPDASITGFQLGIVLGGVVGTQVTITPFGSQTIGGSTIPVVFNILYSSMTLVPSIDDWLIL